MDRIYQYDKWLKIINNEKYQSIRDKITTSFKDLIFDEEPHKYYLHGQEMQCVSTLVHTFQEHFDTEAVAQRTFERNFNNPESKYYQMTVEQIIQNWKDISSTACQKGSERHNFGESVFWFMVGKPENIIDEFKDRRKQDEDGRWYMESQYPKEDAVVKFWKDLVSVGSVIPILAENKVYDTNIMYSGTFDLLCYYDAELDGKSASKSGLYCLDYKTNVDLYKNFGNKKLLAPFDELLDMSLSVYKLQIAAYVNCLKNINLDVIARALIWLKPDGTYEKIKLEDYSDKLKQALLERIKKYGTWLIE
jgi:hypothetical protein